MDKKANHFSGQLGFVLAAAGSAVGVGNLWRFPYLAAKDGGGRRGGRAVLRHGDLRHADLLHLGARVDHGQLRRDLPLGAQKAVRILSVIYLAASAVIALGYSVFYFEVQLPNGSAAQLLDIMDYVSNSVMMPFIALLLTILIGWIKTPDYVIGEMERNGEHFRRKSVYRVMIRYIAPVMMLILFLQSTGILS